jgi:hypothetical protein
MDLLNYEEEDEEIIAQVEKSTKINSVFLGEMNLSSSSSSLALERRATEGSGQILRSFEESSLGASTSARRIASKLFNRQQDDSSKRTSTGFTSVSSLNKRQREDVPLTNNITDDKMIPLSSSHYPPPPPPSVQYVDEKQSTSDFHQMDKRMRRELGLTDSNLDKETLPSTHIVSAGSLRGEWRPSFQQNDSETVATGRNKVVGKMWSHETGTAVAVHELSRAAKSRHSIQSVAAAAIAASASLSAEHSVNIKTKAQTYAKYGW